MNHQEAIERVQKLLRLAKSDNANEAAVAMAMAQRVMDEYQLDAASLNAEPDKEEPIQNFMYDLLDDSTSTWRGRLAMVLASANGCKVYLAGHTKGLCLIGRKSDADTVRYMYSWLTKETDRLAKEAGKGLGKTWSNNFRLGVVDAVSEKINASKREFKAKAIEQGRGTALAKIDSNMEQVEKWTKENFKLRSRQVSQSRYDSGAREAGREAGRNLNLGNSGSLGSGSKALGA